MVSLNFPIKSWWHKIKAYAVSSFFWRNKSEFKQEDADKKLVYSLSPRKLPTKEQFRYLNKFLNPREYLIVKICAFIILIGSVYYGFIFINSHFKPVPARGGAYSEGLVGYPRSINPLYASSRDVDRDISSLVYSQLYRYNTEGVLTPDLVDSLEISNDGKEYVFHIKNGVMWHNGERLTADDIVFTVETIQNSAFHSPLRGGLSIAIVEKIDDLTVRFKLNEPFSPFIDLLTFGIMPKRLWESVAPDGALISDLNLKPIGSGPYKFQSLIRSSAGDIKEYVLEVNDSYYGDIPLISTLNFKLYPNYEEAVKALNSKQILGISYLPLGWKEDLLAQNSLNFFQLSQPRLVSIFFNQAKNSALANRDNRVALASALDKDAIVKQVFQGDYRVANSPILDSSWAHSNALVIYPYNFEAAKNKFSEEQISLAMTVVDTGANLALADEIKNYWEKAGVKINIRIVSSEQSAEIVKNRDFEALLYGQALGGDPDIYAFWHSEQIGQLGLNLSDYKNLEVDKLLVEARQTNDKSERVEKYRQIQQIITEDVPAIFLYSPSYAYVQVNKLHGFSGQVIINPADRFSGISNWYLKTSRDLSW